MELFLYNTLTRKKEAFKPIKKSQVGLYTCGPTVYWYATIGNFRTYIFSDILRRVLEYDGLEVKHVMNVTDVGHLTSDSDTGKDKMEEAAAKEHKTAQQLADFYLRVFKEDMQKLHILSPEVWPKATEHIKEQIELIKKLEKRGFTYETSDGVYFDSSKFPNYSKLARLNVEGLEKGKRVSSGEKKHKTDFALWKFSDKPGMRQQEWPSPWGVGYPGWHIECSAMSMKYLGESFDIHTGGEDHVPVHHTNEIAQSEAATGKKFVNYWLHGSFLTFKGEKVSKSKGGLYTISELEEKGYRPEHYRYMCLLTHYRKKLDFSLEHLDAAKAAFNRLIEKYFALGSQVVPQSAMRVQSDEYKDYLERFSEAVNDDLNMPKAVQIMWKMLDDEIEASEKSDLLAKFDSVFGLDLYHFQRHEISVPLDIETLVDERESARKNKDWKLADKLREKIHKKGFEVEDSVNGPKVKKI
jgi:cysteinyl-tRNA synthetase